MARTGRPKVELVLTEDEREQLTRWSRRAKSSQALALRSRIVLACADGVDNKTVAARVGCAAGTVGKWRARFVELRLDGLLDEPRPGRPPVIGVDQVEDVVVATLESTPANATHWSRAKIADGTVISSIHRRHRAVEFKKFLTKIEAQVPDDLQVHLIADNYATHKSPTVTRWLEAHPRFHMHFTPTYSSWINQVERFFAYVTSDLLQRSDHRSVQALEADIRNWVKAWNNDPRPFIWTKSAEQILDSLARLLQRTTGAGH